MKKISERALFQRINRKLDKEGQILRKTRPGRWQAEYGEYCILNSRTWGLAERDVDLEEKARELGILAILAES